MKFLTLFLLFTTLSHSGFASNFTEVEYDDMTSNNCESSLELQYNGKFSQYTYCLNKNDRSTCNVLGEKKWYETSKVKNQRNWELAKGTGNAAVTAILALLDVAAVSVAEGAIIVSLGTLTVPVSKAIVVLTAGTGAYAVKTYRRFSDASVLTDDLMNDKPIVVNLNSSDFKELAMQIQTILNRI